MTSVAKELHRLLKRVNRLTDGQASIDDINWDEAILQKFDVVVRPNGGHYKGGKFVFTVTLPECYPSPTPPSVWCQTDIYHPNIDPTDEQLDEFSTNVCLNLLESGTWSPSFGLEGLIHGLVFLMHNPNLDDPFSPYFEEIFEDDTFAENVRKYMAGEPVYDHDFHIDFGVKQPVELEHIDKESTGLHEQVSKNNTTNSETGTPGATTEKNDTPGIVGDLKEEYLGLLCNIPNCNEEINNVKELIPESEVDNTAEANCDHEDNVDKLLNEINGTNKSVDDNVGIIHKKDETDFENDTDSLMFDGECLFLPWTKYGNDSNTSAEDNNPELTRYDAAAGIENECDVEADASATINELECANNFNLSTNAPIDIQVDVTADSVHEGSKVPNKEEACTHGKLIDTIGACTETGFQKCDECLHIDSSMVIPDKDSNALAIADTERNSERCNMEENFEVPETAWGICMGAPEPFIASPSNVQSSAVNQKDSIKDNVALKMLGWILFLFERLL